MLEDRAGPATGADHAEIGCAAAEARPERELVLLVATSNEGDVGARTDRVLPEGLFEVLADDIVGLGDALGAGELFAVIEDGDVEVQEVGEFRQGTADVSGADDEEDRLRLDYLDVDGRGVFDDPLGEPFAGDVEGLGDVAGESVGRVRGEGVIEVGSAHRTQTFPGAFNQHAGAGNERAGAGFEDGSEEDRVATFGGTEETLGDFEHGRMVADRGRSVPGRSLEAGASAALISLIPET